MALQHVCMHGVQHVLRQHRVQISADQLKDLGVEWVILGHSERRGLLQESNQLVGEKCAQALSNGLKVIACIGETLEQREGGQASAACWLLC